MATRLDEAVIISLQMAAGRRYCQWCLALAQETVSPGNGPLSLRFNCARLSLDAIQVRTSATCCRSTGSDVGRGEDPSSCINQGYVTGQNLLFMGIFPSTGPVDTACIMITTLGSCRPSGLISQFMIKLQLLLLYNGVVLIWCKLQHRSFSKIDTVASTQLMADRRIYVLSDGSSH